MFIVLTEYSLDSANVLPTQKSISEMSDIAVKCNKKHAYGGRTGVGDGGKLCQTWLASVMHFIQEKIVVIGTE